MLEKKVIKKEQKQNKTKSTLTWGENHLGCPFFLFCFLRNAPFKDKSIKRLYLLHRCLNITLLSSFKLFF